MLSLDAVPERAKCEKSEKIFIDNDSKKYFSSQSSAASSREGRANSVSEEEY